MKKISLLIIVIFLFAAGVFAEDEMMIPEPAGEIQQTEQVKPAEKPAGMETFRLTLDVAFTTVTMKRANDAMNDDTNMTGFGGGFIGFLDLGVSMNQFVLVGPRVGYLFCLPAAFEHVYTVPEALNTKTIMDASIIPIEAGGRLRFGLPFTTDIAVSIGAYAGVCLAHVANNVDVTNASSQKASYVENYGAIGFSGELTGAVEFKLMQGVHFNVNGGYRMAGVTSVKQLEDSYYAFSSEEPVKVSSKDTVLQDGGGIDIPFDFSGMNIGVGISLAL